MRDDQDQSDPSGPPVGAPETSGPTEPPADAGRAEGLAEGLAEPSPSSGVVPGPAPGFHAAWSGTARPRGGVGPADWASAQTSRGPRLPAVRGATGLERAQTIALTDTAISAMPSQSRDLAVLYDRDGPFASAVRILATRLEALKTRLGYRSFLVTSVGEGDGKTVLSNNLALALSEDAERKVALVDANFRSPRAGALFNLDPSRGLLAALSGERPLSQCVARVLGRNLIVLHAGAEHANPASLLGSARFKALLAELYQAVDFMVIDAPKAAPYADVPLLVQHVDAVLVAVARDRTPRHELDLALDTLGRSRVAGVVFVDRPAAGGAGA